MPGGAEVPQGRGRLRGVLPLGEVVGDLNGSQAMANEDHSREAGDDRRVDPPGEVARGLVELFPRGTTPIGCPYPRLKQRREIMPRVLTTAAATPLAASAWARRR